MSFFEISQDGMSNTMFKIGGDVYDVSFLKSYLSYKTTGSFEQTNDIVCFFLMSGALPTQSELDSGRLPYVNTGTSGTWGSQILGRSFVNDGFGTGDASNVGKKVTNGEFYLSVRNPVNLEAEATGVATWWMLAYASNDSSQFDRDAEYSMFVGDISLPGGGGSVIMQDVNVTAGKEYELGPIDIHIPRRYEW